MSNPSYSIGDVQTRTTLSADTLRYYERLGLLGSVPRDPGGRRRYADSHLARLAFIRRAQAMNFSLAEISQLLAMRDDPVNSREQARTLAETKIGEIEERLRILSQLRDELSELIERCRHEGPGPCPILTGIGTPSDQDSSH
ncbi:MAG: heavy metal-responsive transcriptional regulator [Gammaproteobacteria bacterium]